MDDLGRNFARGAKIIFFVALVTGFCLASTVWFLLK